MVIGNLLFTNFDHESWVPSKISARSFKLMESSGLSLLTTNAVASSAKTTVRKGIFFCLNRFISSSVSGREELAISACPLSRAVIPRPEPPPEMAILKSAFSFENSSARFTAKLTSVSEPFILIA
ncbi:hypothetical protein D3C86_1719750 [compost metagenome]